MGNSSIDLSLANVWQSWFKFIKGKRKTKESDYSSYCLEQNLENLHFDLNSGRYKHGGYKKFIVTDNKRRQISVASVRDRAVHRLLYEYLNRIYDKTFVYDAWSCRKNKGLTGAIERTQKFLYKHTNAFVWRADIKKFFDNVDRQTLLKILSLKIKDAKAMFVLQEIIASHATPARERERERERE